MSLCIMTEEQLLKKYQRMVEMLAKQFYRNCGRGNYELEDLIQVGNMGLIHAARTYDSGQNVKFMTHAFNRVRFALSRYVRGDTGVVKLPSRPVRKAIVPQRVRMPESWEVSVDDLLLQSTELSVSLLDALKVLSPKHRDILYKLHVEQKTTVEVAAEMGCAANTVYTNAQKAINQLRVYMQENCVSREDLSLI